MSESHFDSSMSKMTVFDGQDWRNYDDVSLFDWRKRLSELLLTENLCALCGLGTSLGIIDQQGNRPAPTMRDFWNMIQSHKNYDSLSLRIPVNDINENAEAFLSYCQVLSSIEPDNLAIIEFVNDIEAKIYRACNFVTEETNLSVHETFLRKLARRSIRQPRFRLFTTNYDRCFDEAATRIGFIAVDGFSHTVPQEFDGSYFMYDFVRREAEGSVPDYVPNVFQYMKLHGSVDWSFRSNGRVRRVMTDEEKSKRAMIFPRYGKFESSYQQPYFEMMSRFQISLRVPNTGLLIVGCGCNDKHLNEPILSALRNNVGLKVVLVDPRLSSGSPYSEVVSEMMRLITANDSRLMLLSTTFQDLVYQIPDLVAITEDERHNQRMGRKGL